MAVLQPEPQWPISAKPRLNIKVFIQILLLLATISKTILLLYGIIATAQCGLKVEVPDIVDALINVSCWADIKHETFSFTLKPPLCDSPQPVSYSGLSFICRCIRQILPFVVLYTMCNRKDLGYDMKHGIIPIPSFRLVKVKPLPSLIC